MFLFYLPSEVTFKRINPHFSTMSSGPFTIRHSRPQSLLQELNHDTSYSSDDSRAPQILNVAVAQFKDALQNLVRVGAFGAMLIWRLHRLGGSLKSILKEQIQLIYVHIKGWVSKNRKLLLKSYKYGFLAWGAASASRWWPRRTWRRGRPAWSAPGSSAAWSSPSCCGSPVGKGVQLQQLLGVKFILPGSATDCQQEMGSKLHWPVRPIQPINPFPVVILWPNRAVIYMIISLSTNRQNKNLGGASPDF